MTTTVEQWIGIDIAQKRLDVAVHPAGVYFQLPHTEVGRAALVERLGEWTIAGIVLEATGGLERSVMAELEASGYETRRVNPYHVRAFARSMGKRAKTDRLDAVMLARYGESAQPAVTRVADALTRQMQALVTRRQQVVAMIAVEKTRLHSCEAWVCDSLKTVIGHLETELERLETELAQLSTQRSDWSAKLKLLTSVKGIGVVTSQALLVHLPELGQRTGKSIAALVGVAPFNQDSGKHHGYRHIQGGRKELRSLLYMATLSAVRYNPVFRHHYEQLLQRGKAKKVALIACMRKLLVRLNAMLRDNQFWSAPDPSSMQSVV